MAEEIKTELPATEEKTTPLDPPEAEKQEKNPIDEAKQILKSLQDENKKMSEQIKEYKKITSENILSGKSFAGQPQKTNEEKLRDDARAALAGTGFEHLIS